MIPAAILGRYARSLAEVVFEENLEQKVTEDLETYREIFRAVPDLLKAFQTPAVPGETKEKILAQLTAHYPVASATANFLRILLENNRIHFFEEIVDDYIAAVNERKGIIRARVAAAGPIDEAGRNRLAARLSEITGKTVSIDVATDPALLGGIVVQMGGTIYDGSIRTQLTEMKRRLAET